MGDFQDLSQLLIERGALTIASIQDLAATVVQKMIRGFLARRKVLKLKKARKESIKLATPVPTERAESRAVSDMPSELSSTAVRRR